MTDVIPEEPGASGLLTDNSSTDTKNAFVLHTALKCPICGVSVFSLTSLEISGRKRTVETWECAGCGSPTEVYR